MMFPVATLAAVALANTVVIASEVVPVWAAGPSVADVAKAYPKRARAGQVAGHVNLTCTVANSRPTQCAALSETPEGYGFAHAARELAGALRTVGRGLNGKEVQVPITFDPRVLTGAAVVAGPVLVQLPAPSDFQASFPQAANGVNRVRVVLACTVGEDGAPRDCKVEEEDPPGHGYGDGALAVAGKFRIAPWTSRGEPVIGARVRLPIRYELTPVTSAKP